MSSRKAKHQLLLVALGLVFLWTSAELLARQTVVPAPTSPPVVPVTFDGPFRRTVGQPARYVMTIWLFGNSALEGAGVVDAGTIASQLQALLPAVRVMNAGVDGAGVGMAYETLKSVPVQPGDTVIFYDGGMDLMALQWRAEEANAARYPCAWLDARLSVLRLRTMDGLCGWTRDLTPWYRDTAWLQPQIDRIIAERTRILAYAAAWCQRRQIAFRHILQPAPKPAQTTALWTALRRVETGLDLTPVLELTDGARFIDGSFHTNGAANAVIARAIYDNLVRLF